MDRRRQGVLVLPLALLWALAGCASEADQGAAAADDDAWYSPPVAVATTVTDADQANKGVDAGAYGEMVGAVLDVGAPAPNDSTDPAASADAAKVFGLKPGGVQNVALFHQIIASGKVPAPDTLDIEGWLNEHGTHLPPANPLQPIDLHALVGVFQATQTAQPDVVLQLGFGTAESLQKLQPPLAVVVAVDHSGSMAGPALAQAQKAVLAMLDALPPGSSLGLVTFADTVCSCLPLQPASTGRAEVEEKLGGLVAGGGTDLHGALAASLEMLAEAPAQASRVVLLLTDGGPTVGKGPTEMLTLAKSAKGVRVSSVAVGLNADVKLLATLAGATGGSFLEAPDPNQLTDRVMAGLGSLLVAVATELKIDLDLAPGWKMTQLFGFQFQQVGDHVTIGAPTSQTGGVALQDDAGTPTASGDAAQSGTAETASLTTLYAATENGIVLARLTPPGPVTPAALAMFQVAKVHWQYVLAVDKSTHQGDAKVVVDKLVDIPDGGMAYFASPVSKRAYALLHIGEAARAALVTWQQTNHEVAIAQMDALLAFASGQIAALADADYDHAVLDAYHLMEDLKKNMLAQP